MREIEAESHQVTDSNPPLYNAVNVDSTFSGVPDPSDGSGVSVGQGMVFFAGHGQYYFNPDNPNDIKDNLRSLGVSFREGHSSEVNIRPAIDPDAEDNYLELQQIFYIGDYDPEATNSEEADLAVVLTNYADAPTAPMIIYQDANDANGFVETGGYPGQTKNGSTLYHNLGRLNAESLNNSRDGPYLRAEADTRDPVTNDFRDDGLGAEGGNSGGGAWISSTRPDALNMPNAADVVGDTLSADGNSVELMDPDSQHLIGIVVRGSERVATATEANMRAHHAGAGITPFTPAMYTGEYINPIDSEGNRRWGISGLAIEAAQRNEAIEEVRARYEISQILEDEYDHGHDLTKSEQRAAYAAARAERPLDLEDISNLYPENTLLAAQNVDTSAGQPNNQTPFNGTFYNERMIANQNVTMNIDMGGGTDNVDYGRLTQGITATIGATETSVEKIHAHGTATDTIRGAERITGTASNDTFVLESLSGIEAIDGRDLADGSDRDTLNFDADLLPVIIRYDRNPDGTANRENGYIVNPDNEDEQVRFEGVENIVKREGDVEETAVLAAVTTPEAPSNLTSISEIAGALREQLPDLRDQLGDLADDGTISEAQQVSLDHINSPAVPVVLRTLVENNVDELDLGNLPDNPTEEQYVTAVIEASREALEANGIPYPQAEIDLVMDEHTQASVESVPDYANEDDYSASMA